MSAITYTCPYCGEKFTSTEEYEEYIKHKREHEEVSI